MDHLIATPMSARQENVAALRHSVACPHVSRHRCTQSTLKARAGCYSMSVQRKCRSCSRSCNPLREARNVGERNGDGVDQGPAVVRREPCERKQSLRARAKTLHLIGQTKSFLGTVERTSAVSWRQRRKPIG